MFSCVTKHQLSPLPHENALHDPLAGKKSMASFVSAKPYVSPEEG